MFLRFRGQQGPSSTRGRGQSRRPALFRPEIIQLEDRVVPAVSLTSGFSGLSSTGWTPPDTNLAVGPNHVVETVNESYAIYNKTTGALLAQNKIVNLFPGLDTAGGDFDPTVLYDDLAGRFVIEAQVKDSAGTKSFVDIAVSNSSDPTLGFTEFQIEVDEGRTYWTDNGKLGYNADAYVFTGNLYTFAGSFGHEVVVTINKTTLTDYVVDRNTYSMIPARMHGSVPGGPMWFVQSTWNGGSSVDVVRMDNVLSSTPTFTDNNLSVNSYNTPPAAPQPGGTTVETNDCRTLNVEWNHNYLVAAFNSVAGSDAAASWYQFNTGGSNPSLTQQGVVHPGSGISTYYPSVGVDASGDLALTYMQSSSSQYVSMYVTGRLASDPLGTMAAPIRAKAGAGALSGGRAGDYSGISLDPSTANTFWAGNEYAPSSAWGTWLAQVHVSTSGGSDTPPTVAAPASASPSLVIGTTTNLSVLGADDTGESSLTYTWTILSGPSGATAPSYSANGTNAAKNTTATFHQAGNYTFQATITDPAGLTASSSVVVVVNQTLTSIIVSPKNATLPNSATQLFLASAVDQFGKAMPTQPLFTWSIATGGIGTISSAGMYTAPSSGTGSATIRATGASLSGTASVTVAVIPAAPSGLTAGAVTSHQVNLAWTESSTNATGFNIQRSSNGGSTWSQIASVAGTARTYSDSTVSKSKTYEYRVDAYNSAGASGWSNVATVTTPKTPQKTPPGRYPEPDVPSHQGSLSAPASFDAWAANKPESAQGSGDTRDQVAISDRSKLSGRGLSQMITDERISRLTVNAAWHDEFMIALLKHQLPADLMELLLA